MKFHQNPVIVIGGGITGLGIIRNLGSLGIDVYCLVNDKDFAIYSRYCKGSFIVPNVEEDVEVLRCFLIKQAKQVTQDVVLIPARDLAVLNLSYLLDDIHHYVTSISSRDVVETMVKKKEFYKSLQEHGVPHPLTLYPAEEDLDKIQQKIAFPLFIKPSISPLFSQQFGRKGFIAYNTIELKNYLQLTSQYDLDVMIQEIVLGSESNIYALHGYFNKKSEPQALVVRQKIRQPSFFSVPSASVTIPIKQVSEITKIIVQYLKTIKYKGIFCTEFKKDARDQQYKVLEVNARSTWHNPHITVCGVNHILMSYKEALGQSIQSQWAYKTGIYCVNILWDLRSIKRLLVEGKLSRHSLLRSYLGPTEWLIYKRNDIVPFIKHVEFIKHIETGFGLVKRVLKNNSFEKEIL